MVLASATSIKKGEARCEDEATVSLDRRSQLVEAGLLGRVGRGAGLMPRKVSAKSRSVLHDNSCPLSTWHRTSGCCS